MKNDGVYDWVNTTDKFNDMKLPKHCLNEKGFMLSELKYPAPAEYREMYKEGQILGIPLFIEAYRQKAPALASQQMASQRRYPSNPSDHQSVSMYSHYGDPRLTRSAITPDTRRKEVKPSSAYTSYAYGVANSNPRSGPMNHMYDDRDNRRNLSYYASHPTNPRDDSRKGYSSGGHVNVAGEQVTEVFRSPYRQGK